MNFAKPDETIFRSLKEGIISWEQNRQEQVTNTALSDTAFDRVTPRSAVTN